MYSNNFPFLHCLDKKTLNPTQLLNIQKFRIHRIHILIIREDGYNNLTFGEQILNTIFMGYFLYPE